MRRYSVTGTIVVGTNKTLAVLTSSSAIRPEIYDLIIGSGATPGDQAGIFQAQRFTAAGTTTAVTPEPLDPNDPASVAAAGSNASVEPTYTANKVLLTVPLNQRATFRWVAAPGSELRAPATASNGIGVQSLSNTGTAAHYANFLFAE